MTELLQTEKNEDEEKVGPPGNNNQPPIAHISPRGTPGGRRVSLCGAPILGIPTGDIPFVLCPKCIEINGGDPRPWYAAGCPF